MVLFNIYYNGDSPTDFSVDLTENAIIKRESVARLLKAYIPHAKSVEITNTDIMGLIVNDRNSAPIAIAIPATGRINLSVLAGQITDAINQAMTANNQTNIVAGVSFDRSKGAGAGCFKIDIKATNRHFTEPVVVDWADAPYSEAGYLTIEEVQGVSSSVSYTKTGDNSLNADFRDGAGNPVAVGSFAQCFTAESIIKLDYFSKTSFNNLDHPPSQFSDYGCIIYEIGVDIGTNTFWCGACSNEQDLIVDRQPNDDVGLLDKLNNVPFAMVVPFTTRNSGTPNNSGAVDYIANEFYAWEMTATGDLNLVANQDLQLAVGDKISAVVSENQQIQYWYKASASDIWIPIDTIDGRERYIVKASDTLHPAGSIFEVSAGNTQVLNLVGGSLDNGGISDYGKFIKATLNTDFATALGFTSSPYTSDTPDTLANLSFANEQAIVVEDVSESCPFVNINITNLPLKGFVNNDTQRVGLSTSTTLGTLSRYDSDGSMLSNEALFMDYPTHTAELKNANELYLSQFKFQIRDSDGKIPTDLDTPLGIVFEIVEGQ